MYAQETIKDTIPNPKLTDSSKVSKDKETVVEKIDNLARKDNIFAKLLRQVWIVNREVKDDNIVPESSVPSEDYFEYNGKYIRDIHIRVLDAFGYTVNDPVCYDVTFFERMGNAVHYPTRQWIIANKLLLQQGDSLTELELKESERLLRQSSSITDARIYVEPVEGSPDSVDLRVLVQDIWNLGASVSGNPLRKNGAVSVTDINFLGLGHTFNNRVGYDQNRAKHWQYGGNYHIPEIANTYISSSIHYSTEGTRTNYGLRLNRGFFSPTVRWAGGLFYDLEKNGYSIPSGDTTFNGTYRKLYQDLWAGYALNRNDNPIFSNIKGQFILSGRVQTNYYFNQNLIPRPVLEQLQDQTMILGSFGFSFREFYKDRFIFGFGRTEDIPTGYLLTYTTGIDTRTLFTRIYNGVQVAFAERNKRNGYYSASIEAGGFAGRGRLEEGVARANVLYFTDRIKINRWFIRHFVSSTLTMGINRQPWESINLNGAIRGFNANVGGTQRIVTNYEMNFFMPYNWFGFRPVAVLFADFGILGGKDRPIVKSRLHQGYGIGLRLKNEHLIFNTFQISIHYFPNIQQFGGNPFQFVHTMSSQYRYPNLQFLQPYILGFW